MELISGKPSMREGPAHRDLPFGQMTFFQKRVSYRTGAVIQRQPNPLQPSRLVLRHTELLESRRLSSRNVLVPSSKSPFHMGELRVQERMRVLSHCHLVTSDHRAQ